MSHSLKSKLLLAVMTPLAVGWGCWLGSQHFQMTRQQKGHDDPEDDVPEHAHHLVCH